MTFDLSSFTSWIENCKRHMERTPQMNEQNTKAKLITPLLELLGWDIHTDIELEYPVRVGSSTVRVDYALMLNGKPVVLVEAKGFDTDIGPSQAEQVISYGRLQSVKWAIITNGKDLRILNTQPGNKYEQCLFKKLTVNEYLANIGVLKLLSKDGVSNGDIEKAYLEFKTAVDYVNSLRTNKKALSAEISSIISKDANNRILPLIESEVASFIDAWITKVSRLPVVDSNPVEEFKSDNHSTEVPEKMPITRDWPDQVYGPDGDRFMAKVSDNAKDFFSSILALNGRDDFSVKWGSIGFSLRANVGDKNIPIGWGFNKTSSPGEVFEFKLKMMKMVRGNEVVVQKYRKLLMNYDFVEQCGSSKDVKIIFEKKLSEAQIIAVLDVIKDLAAEINRNGLE